MNSTNMQRRHLMAAAVASSLLPVPIAARAQSPSGGTALRFVIPYAAGADTLIRQYVQILGQQLERQTVVENVPGAATMLGMLRVAQARADGSVVGMVSDSISILRASGAPNSQEIRKQLQTVGRVAITNFVLVVSTASGLRTLDQLINYGRKMTGQLTYGSPGNGSPHHLAMVSLCHRLGITPLHVPFGGASAALNEVAAGRVDASFVSMTALRPLLETGKVLPLAVGSQQRLKALAGVPTFAELGQAGFEAQGWFGVVAPAGMNAAAMLRLESGVAMAANSPSLREPWEAAGYEAAPLSASAFAQFIEAQVLRYSELLARTKTTL